MTSQSNSIMSALQSALRRALTAHPHLLPESLECTVADVRQLDDILREFMVRIWDVEPGWEYGIMSPNFVDEGGAPFLSGAFVTLEWLDDHALLSREEFDQAYIKVMIEQGSCEVVTLPSGETSLKYYAIIE
jgi:hypothetical protein